MILKFREPVYHHEQIVEDSPNVKSERVGWRWTIYGEVSDISYSDVSMSQESINGEEEENQVSIKVDRWVQDYVAMELTGPKKYLLMTFKSSSEKKPGKIPPRILFYAK